MSQEKQIEEMADIIYSKINGANFDDVSDAVVALYDAGYRKQIEGKWEIVIGSNGREKMVCTNCRHQQDLASTFTYCPNCGAKINGRITYE